MMPQNSGYSQNSCLWPGQGGPGMDYISGPPPVAYCQKKIREVAVLGSTGSIGRNVLAVMEQKPDNFRAAGLACATNVKLLAAQAKQWRPPLLAVLDAAAREKLREILPSDYKPRILTGSEGYAQMACAENADIVVGAQVGAAGLPGVLAAAFAGKVIALANKESLVLAGALLRKICAQSGASILPLDSEHHAVFQCVAGRGQSARGIILTASGGPFLGMGKKDLARVTASDALKHPNWNMGSKITIDSATLMNKGLEIIEAMHLYGMRADQVEALVHPQSVVHSFARFADNSLLAQLAMPDMRLPVANCLFWPICEYAFVPSLDLAEIGSLTFSRPDHGNFPCLGLARKAMASPVPPAWQKIGLNPACVILNAANESAVEMFLAGQCGFCDIPALIENALSHIDAGSPGQADMAEATPAERALAIFSAIRDLDSRSRERARRNVEPR